MSVGEMSVGEMSVGEVSVGEMSVGEMSWIRYLQYNRKSQLIKKRLSLAIHAMSAPTYSEPGLRQKSQAFGPNFTINTPH